MSADNPSSFPKTQPCGCCRGAVGRRTVLRGAAAVAAVTIAGPAFAQAIAAEMMPPQPGDFLVSDLGSTPLTPQNIRLAGGPYDAWAMSPDGVVRRANYLNRLQLFRYDPAELPPEVAEKAGEGVIALSVICTHAGCEATEYLQAEKLVSCPCHGSRFDPKNNGAVAMGPAMRKLPQLTLAVTDGKLTVTSVFDSKVGGDEAGVEDR